MEGENKMGRKIASALLTAGLTFGVGGVAAAHHLTISHLEVAAGTMEILGQKPTLNTTMRISVMVRPLRVTGENRLILG